MSKEAWFRAYEQLLNEGATDEQAAENAQARMIDNLAALADRDRDRAKEEGYA